MKYLLNLAGLLLILLFILGCKKEVSTTSDNTTNLQQEDTLAYNIERLLRVEEGCQGDTCARVEINYVTLDAKETDTTAQKINQSILENLRGGDYTNVVAYANGFLREYAKDKAEIPDMPAWNEERNQQVINNTGNVLCVKTTFYSYTGGAHGLYGTTYNNFDPQTGNTITKADVFVPAQEEALLEVAEDFFRKEMAIASSESLNQAGYDFEDNIFYLPDNFGLLEDRIIFTYGLYEIASYVQGEQEFSIPYSALGNLVKL